LAPALSPSIWADRIPNGGLIGQAAAGGVLALAWAPCAGPTLGAALALAANRGWHAHHVRICARGRRSAPGSGIRVRPPRGELKSQTIAAASRGRFALGLSLVFGAFILTGFDHTVESVMIAAMPNWLANAAAAL
jgi:cytochrome c-type biogenesis protein